MLSCKKVTRLVSESLERPLTLGEKTQLKLHLLICSACTNFDKNLKTLRVAMRHFNSPNADTPPKDDNDEGDRC